jgi:hypothetical protein
MMVEMVRPNLVDDLLQTIKISSKSLEYSKNQNLRRVYFVICNSCYWCASYFGIAAESASSPPILHCYVCNSNNNTRLMPI